MLPLFYIPAVTGAGFKKVYESTTSGTSYTFQIDPSKMYMIIVYASTVNATAAEYIKVIFNNDTNSADYRDSILYGSSGGVGNDYSTYSGTVVGSRVVRIPSGNADASAIIYILPWWTNPTNGLAMVTLLSLFHCAAPEVGVGAGQWETTAPPPNPLPVEVTVSNTSTVTMYYIAVYEVLLP